MRKEVNGNGKEVKNREDVVYGAETPTKLLEFVGSYVVVV